MQGKHYWVQTLNTHQHCWEKTPPTAQCTTSLEEATAEDSMEKVTLYAEGQHDANKNHYQKVVRLGIWFSG